MVSKMDGALMCYTLDEWSRVEQRILNMAVKSENMRRFRRIFIGGAFECTLDKQGRILIPPTLRQYASLDKEVVLVGVLDHFEIWAREGYLDQDTQLQEDMKKEDMRNEFAALGL
jgi:MraZ protein